MFKKITPEWQQATAEDFEKRFNDECERFFVENKTEIFMTLTYSLEDEEITYERRMTYEEYLEKNFPETRTLTE